MDEETYRGILESVHDGVYMTDHSRRICYWNGSAERITGFTAKEVLGTHCWDNLLQHVDEDGNSLCRGQCALSQALCHGSCEEMEAFLHHKKGHRVRVRIRASPVRNRAGAVIGAVEVFTDNFSSRQAEERIAELERMAYLDGLTEVANRRYADISLAIALNEYRRYGWPFGVILLDVDRFKEINDRFGHAMGDAVLRIVAATLTNTSRPSDLVARWGGDEFLVIVKNTSQEQLDLIAEKYENLVAASAPIGSWDPIGVAISAGAAAASPNDTPTSLVARADRRMYARKRGIEPRARASGEAAEGR
jgi:diguanylate cyclase (GGDEF)-like protein/PAS domain S-box-containing protein